MIQSSDNMISVEDLDKLGEEGWELVCRIEDSTLIFKRPIENTKEEKS